MDDNQWFDIREKDGWQYIHEPAGAAVLGLDGDGVLGRYEVVPMHGPDHRLVALSGRIEAGEQPAQTAVRELYEEAGYRVFQDDLRALGTFRPTKGSDYLVHGYCVTLTGRQRFTAPGDGSEAEHKAYCRWIPRDDALLSDDPLLVALIERSRS